MKNLLFTLIMCTIISNSFAITIEQCNAAEYQSNTISGEKELFILLTNGDKEVLSKMVAPYLMVSAKSWEKRTLLIWGPAEKTIAESVELKELIAKLKEGGVILKACKWCADQYSVADKLSTLGFEVAYMGTPLTEALQSNQKVMVF